MIWARSKYKEGMKIKAEPKSVGFCSICGEQLIPKCGEIKIWHWSHKSNNECDSWYEPESKWHIDWKNEFPPEQQEVIIGKHRADIRTRTRKIIELQNSPINPKEITERENFYGDMIWLLNGYTLGKNISFNKTNLRWNWMPGIIYASSKPIFVDFNSFIIRINDCWKFKKRTYCSYTKYTKNQFLHIYGDIFDFFSEATKIKQATLEIK